MQDLTLEHFVGHLNKDFTVATEHGGTPFTLIEAQAAGTTLPQGMTRLPFSLLFHSAAEMLFPQGVYRVNHPEMGELEIFLVPVARHSPGFVYQAIFN